MQLHFRVCEESERYEPIIKSTYNLTYLRFVLLEPPKFQTYKATRLQSNSVENFNMTTLHYFNIRARGELARTICAVGDIDYTDHRIKFPPKEGMEEWAAFKPNTPLGQVPTLEVEGKGTLSQSMTICRYLAKKAGLAGSNDWEAAECDMFVDHANDLEEMIYKCYQAKTDEMKKMTGDKLFDGGMQSWAKVAEAQLKARGGKYFVGGKLTWADLATVVVLDYLLDPERFLDIPGQEKRHNLPKNDPLLADLRERVHAHPKVKAWLVKRPKTHI